MSGTTSIDSHVHWYRMYQTNYSRVRASFALIQVYSTSTTMNNKGGGRTANNTFYEQVFTAKAKTVIHWHSLSTVHLFQISFVDTSLVCIFCRSTHITCFISDWTQCCPETVSSRSVGIAPGNQIKIQRRQMLWCYLYLLYGSKALHLGFFCRHDYFQ